MTSKDVDGVTGGGGFDDGASGGDPSYYAIGGGSIVTGDRSPQVGAMGSLLAGATLVDSFQGALSSCEDHSTESRMCTEESVERMTSSTEGMVSLSEDSSGRDTYAQAHVVCQWSSPSADTPGGGTSGARAGPSVYPQHADTVELDESDEQMNGLLGSYHEISIEDAENARTRDRSALLGGGGGDDTEEEVSNLSPDSGPLSPLDHRDANYDYEDDYEEEAERGAVSSKWDAHESNNRRPNSLQLHKHLVPSSGCGASRQSTVTAAASSVSSATAAVKSLHQPPKSRHTTHHSLVVPNSAVQFTASSESVAGSCAASGGGGSGNDGATCPLSGLQGLVLRDGEMVSFVAEDLQEQIRRASPVVWLGDTPSFPGSRSSTPSLYKQALTPQIAPVDPTVLADLEVKARSIASSVDNILENLTGTLHSMSSLTVDCMESYHDAVCKTCDHIDGNIKSMYQLMAKFEEIGNLMRPVHRLSNQIKEIKRLLDLLEHVTSSGGS